MTPSSSQQPFLTSSPPKISDGLPYVAIVWKDAYTNVSDEVDLADTAGFGRTMVCWDIGWLVRETKEYLVLAVGACPDDNTVRHSNTIPRSMILEVVPLGVFKWQSPISRRKKTRSTRGSTTTSTQSTPSTGPISTTDPSTDLSP